ncbi:MAG: FMN-binding protein [Kiritimatiellia bacterium]|jgi:hypothetical protein|nr:FMN-binding protein [Kiritimatiellia bacterium]MDP6631159.1 FMN-binding protein [Kiritimatiellia bacterium]MDP6809819.1 FMN-binding protein [Kiritimatiellia bacterium]MDP7025071.1 FMN-binding protein [Kiritimatiellia bacterium]
MTSSRNSVTTQAARRALWLAACLAIAVVVRANGTDDRTQAAVAAAFPGATATEHKVGISSAVRAQLGEAAKAHLAPRWRWRYLAIDHPDHGRVGFGGTWKTVGRHGKIEMLVLTDVELTVVGVTILKHREQHGKGIARASFLDQFRAKKPGDRWKLGQDIDGISSATVSSRAVTSGVRNCLAYLRTFALSTP